MILYNKEKKTVQNYVLASEYSNIIISNKKNTFLFLKYILGQTSLKPARMFNFTEKNFTPFSYRFVIQLDL